MASARSNPPQSAAVIGAGPNGLTAAILLAQAGIPTTLYEAEPTPGGSARTAALTLPGFLHDICSAVHPLGISSPAFKTMPLAEHGLEWIHPPIPLAHPFEDGSAAVLHHSLEQTAEALGPDGPAWTRALAPIVRHWPELSAEILAPIHLPAHPFQLARFGLLALPSAEFTANRLFKTASARALFAGIAAHASMPLDALGTAAFGWILAAAGHAAGWPIARTGSQKIAESLLAHFLSLGGDFRPNTRLRSLAELPAGARILCDVTPRQFLNLAAGSKLPAAFTRKLTAWRYGPGVFKIDWALSAPIPWKSELCTRAGTVHLGGTLPEIAASEQAVAEGTISPKPFVLLSQPSLFDPTRAPSGSHTAWAYCHVPNGSTIDAAALIESRIEQFAPGFQTRILARSTLSPADLERHNPNLVGGDIAAGLPTLAQLLLRPTRLLYRTPLPGVYLCSASTPPGPGVHGMCGYHAARLALGQP